MPRRFHDDRKTLYGFGDRFLVVCPRCGACAEVHARRDLMPTPRLNNLNVQDARLSCTACGYSATWRCPRGHWREVSDWGDLLGQGDAFVIGAPVDWFFHHPLWLQTPCCGSVLWAYNAEHLAYLEAYVGADLRERRSGHSLAGRLPRWMTSAKNRTDVLRCIGQLKEKALNGA